MLGLIPQNDTNMSSSDDERPSFGGGGLGTGFGPERHGMDEAEPEPQPPNKRMKFTHFRGAASTSNGSEKQQSASMGKPNSFAAKMMAKMGYKEGQGLGSDGRGRLAPIDVQLRPEGAGLGLVKEKTKQVKAEEKREAQLQGKSVEDSSEEERKRRKERKERAKKASGQASSTRPKRPKFKTVIEIENELGGLQIPDVLKSMVDLTGKEATLSTSNLVPAETEASKIAKRAQRDLEAFADTWHAIQDEKKYHEAESVQLVTELDRQNDEARQLESVLQAVQGLELSSDVEASDEGQWETITSRLEKIEVDFQDSLFSLGLQDVAAAAIQPLFRKAMASWDPLAAPEYLTSFLQRLRHVLGITTEADKENSLLAHNGNLPARGSNRKSTTTYETLIYTLWLPPVRRAVADWDVEDPTPLIELCKAWQPLLPAFVHTSFIEQLLIPRLLAALSAWKPSRRRRHQSHHRRHPSAAPDTWLIEWLPYLPPYHHDPSASSSLLPHVKRKLRSLVATHDLTVGIPPYLTPWKSLLGPAYPQLLTVHLLPRLAAHLSAHLVIDPSDQDLAPLATVLAFAPLFSATATAELLAAHLFPRFHETLHAWLTGDPNYAEVADWLLWWHEQLPAALHAAPAVARAWARAFATVAHALDLGARAADLLPPPASPAAEAQSPSQHAAPPQTSMPEPGASRAADLAPATFRDVLDRWVADEGLLLLPLRAAHPAHGAPLFRLTASATGRGGCVACLRGDVAWVRRGREGSAEERWEPVGLGAELVGRAGG